MNPQDLDYLLVSKDASAYTGSAGYKQELFISSMESGKEWYADLTEQEVLNLPENQLRENCKRYVLATRQSVKPVGFIPSVLLLFIGKAILSWVVNKIIDHLMKVDKPRIKNKHETITNPVNVV